MGDWRDDEFDAALNSKVVIEVRGHLFEPADVLATRPDIYLEELELWRRQEEEALVRRVLEEFPAPIALRFGRYRNAMDPSVRLLHLRDTWEAIITLLAAITLAEVRVGGHDASTLGIDARNHLKFHSIAYATDLLEKLHSGGIQTPSISRVDGVLQLMANLNRLRDERNVFSHGEAPNEERANELLSACEPIVIDSLRRIDFFSDYTLCHYVGDGNDECSVVIYPFRGRLTEADLQDVPLDEAECREMRSRRNAMEDVWVLEGDGFPVNLSPLICWVQAPEGNQRFLAYLDDVRPAEDGRVFHYRVYGDARPRKKNQKKLNADWEALRVHFRGRPTPSRNEQQRRIASARRSVSKGSSSSSTSGATDGKDPIE